MTRLTDEIGKIVHCQLSTVSSDGSGSSNATGVNIQGMESVLFIVSSIIAGTTDGGASDGSINVQIQYASNSSSGSDAATSNATMSCTDAIVTFTSTMAVGTLLTLEVNISAKGFPDATGYLFPRVGGDSVSRVDVVAIPYPATSALPIGQTVACVVADD